MEANMFQSKPKKKGHDCRKRKHGNPKIGTGICHGFDYRDAVKERIRGRRLERKWLRVVDPDDSEM